MRDEDDLIDYERCTYCGKDIPADMVRCPMCGNYTDGAGPIKPAGRAWDRRKIVIAIVAILTLATFLATTLRGC